MEHIGPGRGNIVWSKLIQIISIYYHAVIEFSMLVQLKHVEQVNNYKKSK